MNKLTVYFDKALGFLVPIVVAHPRKAVTVALAAIVVLAIF